MVKKLKPLLVMVLALIIIVSFLGCNQNDGANTSETSKKYDKTVKIAFTTWLGYAPLFVAKEKGLFEKNGVDVDLRIIESDSDINAAARAGQVEGIACTADTVMMFAGSGLDFQQVLTLDTSNGGDGVVSKKEFSSLEDLKGKKIALNTTGGCSLFFFNYLLDKAGMDMKDFNCINMNSGDAGSAFVGGKVDAAVTWEPWLSNTKKTDFGKVIYSSKDYPGIIVDTMGFSRDFVNKYPDTVKAVVDSWFDALAYIDENQDESYKIMAKSQDITVEQFKETVSCLKYYNKEMNQKYFESGDFKNVCDMAGKLWKKIKLVKTDLDAESFINGDFVK